LIQEFSRPSMIVGDLDDFPAHCRRLRRGERAR
jgi:hypothetical protein